MDPELVEALSLLRDRDMELSRVRGRKVEAAQRLFTQLRSLDGRYGLVVRERHRDDWNELAVQIAGAQIEVTYYNEHGVTIARDERSGTEVPLDFDRDAQAFVGRELDRFRTSVPGEPIPRRPAIAVLVEAILAAAKEEKTK